MVTGARLGGLPDAKQAITLRRDLLLGRKILRRRFARLTPAFKIADLVENWGTPDHGRHYSMEEVLSSV